VASPLNSTNARLGRLGRSAKGLARRDDAMHTTNNDTHLIFNCTPQVPFSVPNVLAYIAAFGGLPRGTFNRLEVRHDAKSGKRCRNCGRRV
jgi:hypothetical protein